jgi:hypothetical protein
MRPPPPPRRVLICCAIAWTVDVIGVGLAIVERDWIVAGYALSAAIAAAGWTLAVRQWSAWRELAEATLAASAFLLQRRDDD